MKTVPLIHRDLSWLAFNRRVLEEAADPSVPLYERIRFLAIVSSNIDEFYRVRVASLRAMKSLKRKARQGLEADPSRVLERIMKVVDAQQEEFGEIFRQITRKELRRRGVFLVRNDQLDAKQEEAAREYFRTTLAPLLRPVRLGDGDAPPFLENRRMALVLSGPVSKKKDDGEQKRYLVEIPSPPLPRFLSLPSRDRGHYVIFLDDVIRLCAGELLPGVMVEDTYAVKLTRDAELALDDEGTGDLVEKIREALARRGRNPPCRFLYDGRAPAALIGGLRDAFQLRKGDLMPGGRYHNLHDLFTFPNPFGADLLFQPLPPVDAGLPDGGEAFFAAIRERDRLLCHPYHVYDSVVNFLRGAADDPHTESVAITLYRVANPSLVVEQLARAARNGKSVTAFFEIKARFDEESNLANAEALRAAGGRVLYSLPNVKVHAKLCLVRRREGGTLRGYAYCATGNFNERTAALYTDYGLFTADPAITAEVEAVFGTLAGERRDPGCSALLVSPWTMRAGFLELLDTEVRNARAGREAFLRAKLNSLEDEEMIAALYRAARKGVRIELVVRGICRLVPGAAGDIRVVSIIDRFLEHGRIFWFHHGGEERMYISSADWMRRNLSRRIETAVPVRDPDAKRTLQQILMLQLRDTVKAREVRRGGDRRPDPGDAPVRSQLEIHALLAGRHVPDGTRQADDRPPGRGPTLDMESEHNAKG